MDKNGEWDKNTRQIKTKGRESQKKLSKTKQNATVSTSIRFLSSLYFNMAVYSTELISRINNGTKLL